MITAEEWDTRWWVINDDALRVGYSPDVAAELAARETTEQFGDRPEEQG